MIFDNDSFMGMVVAKGSEKLPKMSPGQMRYVVASNGNYLQRRTDDYQSTSKVDEVPFLKPMESRCNVFFKLPDKLLLDALGLFWTIERRHNAEVGAIILRHQEHGFRLHVPKQTVDSCSVDMDNPVGLKAGWVRFGDIHLHPGSFSAYPSHQDKNDENHQAGLHLIVANIKERDASKVDMHAVFTVDGFRWGLPDFQKVPEGEWTAPRQEWLDLIKVEPPPKIRKWTGLVSYGPQSKSTRVKPTSSLTTTVPSSTRYKYRDKQDYKDCLENLLGQFRECIDCNNFDDLDPTIIEEAQTLIDDFSGWKHEDDGGGFGF